MEPLRLHVRGRQLTMNRTLIMGVVNASPESFSDGGAAISTSACIEQADQLIEDGADIVDVGGQSAVTNQPELEARQELERVLPIVEWLTRNRRDTLVSVDTYKPAVAHAVLAAGAAIVNDVSGLAYPELVPLCARHGAALVVMHTAAPPKQRLQRPDLYADVAADVAAFLSERMTRAIEAGLPGENLILDPGPDFTKTPAQTIALLRHLDAVRALGRPLLLAVSRKDFLGAVLRKPPRGRDAGTIAAITYLTAADPGCIVRVHDVAATRDALRTIDALTGRTSIDAAYTLPDHLRYEPRAQASGHH
jgi:dihydropteroate synthase